MSIAALDRLPSAYDVCWHLAQPDLAVRSPSAARALATLRWVAAQRGGSLGARDLGLIGDPLARELLREAFLERLTRVGADQAIGLTASTTRSLGETLLAGLAGVAIADAMAGAGLADPRISTREMDAAWLGATYASMMARRATAAGIPAESVGNELGRASRAEGLRLRSQDVATLHRFTSYRNDAARRVLGVAAVGSTTPEALAVARVGLDAALGAPYDEVRRFSAVPAALDEAQRSAYLMERLTHAPAIITAAAHDQARVLGDLPVTRVIAQELAALGLLQPLLSGRVALGVRSHSLISLANALGKLIDHLRGKGVSSSPIVIAGMQSAAFSSDAGHGDSLRTRDEHISALTHDMRGWEREAATTGRPLVILGDGPDAAHAALATARTATTRMAYVEVTKGGLNVLRANAHDLPLSVFTIADTSLKQRYESNVIGRWLVEHTERNLRRVGLPGLMQRTAVTIGYGSSIGPGVMHALRAAGHRHAAAVDVAEHSVMRAVADGFPATRRDPSAALPAAGVYFSCAGVDGTLDLRLLATLPDGAYVVNCASKGEIDRDGLVRALRGQVGHVRARMLEPDLLPEHRTLELTFADGRRVFVAKMGEPSFDGIIDKERRMVDMLMASILVSLAHAANQVLGPSDVRGIVSLGGLWEARIAALLTERYGS